MSHRRLVLILALAAGHLVLLSGVWPDFLSPNEWSRVAAARAAVLDGTWSVDHQVRAHGVTEDLALHDERLYSDKAPGTIWLAVPVVGLVHAVAPNASPNVDQYACRLVLATLPALLAAWIVSRWLTVSGERDDRSVDGALVLLFATPFAIYAGLFFAHAAAGGLLVLAAWLLVGRDPQTEDPRIRALSSCLGGLAAGLAAVSEYQAALLTAVILALGVWKAWRRLPWVLVGVLPPVAGLAVYNAVCFGEPWSLSHRHYIGGYSALSRDTLLGFGAPSLEALVGLLISPLTGLLFFSPVLIPAAVSPIVAARRGLARTAVLLGAAVWLMPLVMAAYSNWHAGASFGPRYLVAVIPFWVLGAFLVVGPKRRTLFIGAATASMAVHWLGRVTPPFAIDAHWTASTLRGWAIPCLMEGRWNVPLGASGPTIGLLGLGAAAGAWVAVLLMLARGTRARRRYLVLGTVVLLLAIQFGLGRVTDRQRRWWTHTEGWFRTIASNAVDNSTGSVDDALGRVGDHETLEEVHRR